MAFSAPTYTNTVSGQVVIACPGCDFILYETSLMSGIDNGGFVPSRTPLMIGDSFGTIYQSPGTGIKVVGLGVNINPGDTYLSNAPLYMNSNNGWFIVS